jgi:hypothetical protein
MDMPRASFETWVRDTSVVSCQDGVLEIGVRNAYARDWLSSRLASTVTRLLAGMLDRGDVEVRFVISGDQEAVEPEERELPAENHETAEVDVVHRLRYDEVVFPSRVVAIPGYFSRLIPEIGARNAWLYVGWRQAVWHGARNGDGAPRSQRIPVSQVIRYSGLSRRTFFRAAEDESNWQVLAGLVERRDTSPHWERGHDRRTHRLPNKYTVHMTLRLSRADSQSTLDWLRERIQLGTPLFEALHQATAVKDLVGELLPLTGTESAPVGESSDTQTIMDIAVLLNGGELSVQEREAAETLHRRIIGGFGTILMTHYFLEKVIPQVGLTPPQAWLVTLLRDRCYVNTQTGEVRDEVLVRGGYVELASWLNLSRSKTVWEWLRDPEGAVTAFTAVLPAQPEDDVDMLRLKVRLDEPLFGGANGTHEMAQVTPLDGGDGTINAGANGTHNVAEMAPLDGADGTKEWRKWHSLKLLNTSTNTLEAHSTTQADPAEVLPLSWSLRKLLVQNRAHLRVTKELLAANASARAFVSWLLFACSPAGEGINNPFAYAIASLQDNAETGAGRAYDLLAALPPSELLTLVRWSLHKSSSIYDFANQTSGNPTWDETMGSSSRHAMLLVILLGEQDAIPTWERKDTQISIDGEEVLRETEITHTSRRS